MFNLKAGLNAFFGGREKSLSNPTTEEIRTLIRNGALGSTGFSSPTYHNLVTQGFKASDLVYFIVNDIAQSGSGVPIDFTDQPSWVEDLMTQPQKPSDHDTGKLYKRWMYEQLVFKQLEGSCWAEPTTFGKGVEDLLIIRPDQIQPVQNNTNRDELGGWQVTRNGFVKDFLPEDMFWSRKLDPLSDIEGFAPLAASFRSLQQRNAIVALNQKVLNNDGAVKGYMQLSKPTTDKFINVPTEEKMKMLKKIVNEKFGGDADGKIPVVNWESEWKQMGMTGREMDWSKTKILNAREIAIGNGYPPFLLGFTEGATFNNVAEAEKFLWFHTIFPWVEDILCDLTAYFRMVTGDMSLPVLTLDKKEVLPIQQMAAEKAKAQSELYDKGLITFEEWREMNNLKRIPDGELKLDMSRLVLPIED